jgi:hypothetical protein
MLFWFVVTACGLAGIVAFFAVGRVGISTRMGELWRGRPDRDDWVWVMAAMTGIAYWVTVLLVSYRNSEFFDRYLLPVFPVALVLLAAGHARSAPKYFAGWRTGVTGAILIVIGGLSVAATHDYLEWNRTRWAAFHYLTAVLGIPPTDIDGGYEFNGTEEMQRGYRPPAGKSWWFVHQDDYMVASGPMDGYREIMRFPVMPKYLPVGVRQVVVLRRAADGG